MMDDPTNSEIMAMFCELTKATREMRKQVAIALIARQPFFRGRGV